MVETHTVRRNLRLGGLAFITLAAAATVGQADINTYNFFLGRTSNGPVNAEAQFTVDVQNVGLDGDPLAATQALFVFHNAGTYKGSITEIYFADGTLLNIATLIDKDYIGPPPGDQGVDFRLGANPKDLPGGNNFNTPFVATQMFSSEAAGNNDTGIQKDEWLGILFDLGDKQPDGSVVPKFYNDVLAALDDDSLRVGIHVRDLEYNGQNWSDSFVAPLPGAVFLGMLGMGVAGWRLRRFA